MKTRLTPTVRKHPFAAACAAILALLPLALPCAAAPGLFMKLQGVEAWSALTGASSEMKAPTATEPVAASGFRVTKHPDKTSPLLLKACGAGAVLPRVTLAWQDAAGTVFRITLENALVTSFTTSLPADGPAPVEECVFRYSTVEWSWFGPDGAENNLGGLGARLDVPTGQAAEKTYQPFRAVFDPAAGQPPMLRVTCPVDRGRTYRISASATLDGQWQKLEEFTATEDGRMERLLNQNAGRLFLRVEALD